ncbi:helix-turn-helix domain-containing protein [Brevibacillus porteri]|uniref:helix-turn-helix domain-containing protein n=1 Tax=Brevibacillus porteri TaxID=2126350 RepID=UPI003D1E7450
MITTYSVVGLITDSLKEKSWKQTQFAKEIDVSPSLISRVLRGEKPIPLSMLDKSIALLHLNESECYTLYLEEWKMQKKDSRMVENYLVHCVENEKGGFAERGLNMVLELGGYLSAVYGAGEKLYRKGYRKEALQFFDAVISQESDKKSSLLAMSYYRRLLTFYESDIERSEEAALQLCEHLDYVLDEEMLEAHYKIIATFRLKQKWDHVIRYGERLVKLAKALNEQEYIGDALIRMAIAAREKKDYELSLKYIDQYGSLPIEKYQFFAKGNRLVTLITAGETERINDLLNFAVQNKERCFELMEFLLDSLVKHEKMDLIEVFFQEFPKQIKQLESMKGKHSIYDRHITNFLYAKALYYIKQGNHEGVDTALYAADIAVQLRLDKQAIQAVKLVLENVKMTTPDQYQKCLDLLQRLAS